jgi:deazaflavin-dependent oxidoreductase (nitroreductase family)
MNNHMEKILRTFTETVKNIKPQILFDKIRSNAPVYAWRFGLGPILGRFVMIITQINHKTGNPYKTWLEYFEINGLKYVANVFGIQSQWYRNILANPRVTIQTSDGTEQMVAVPVTQDDELVTIIEWFQARNPKFITNHFVDLGSQSNRKEILKHKNVLTFLRFDPTSEPTPRGLEVDLAWIWPLILIWMLITKPRRKK